MQRADNGENISLLINKSSDSYSNLIAVYTETQAITYKELNYNANQLAHYIYNCYPSGNCNIVIYMERSIDSIICMLATTKSNNTYVPIDYETTSKQFEQIISDCNPAILLSNKQLNKEINHIIQKYNVHVINIEDKKELLNQMPTDHLSLEMTNQIVYILYTSGTTGRPKGVQITHQSFVNFLFSMREKISFSQKDIFLAITPITFDISTVEIYLPLLTGASFVFVDNFTRYDPSKLNYFFSKFNISIMQATPITWQMLIESGWKNKEKIKIICGGEALSVNLAEKLRATTDEVWNFYGPTETTVWSTFYKIASIDKKYSVVSIGKPIANTQLYVLNEKLKQLPVGETGELYIGGKGLSIGYLNRPELNEKSFIPNPFSKEKNERLYKTGDLVVQDADGNFHYLGRTDTQMKIRGHRIEACAIENVLMDYPGIKACVVHDKAPDKKHELIAYLISYNDDIDLKELQTYLKTYFPVHMVPTCYVLIDSFPLTKNGKIDRKNIPNIKQFRYLCPEKSSLKLENRYEEILMDLIASFLQRNDIDPESNFFDLGLHSILLVNISQALNRILSRAISVVDLFEHPTIRSFASFLIKEHPIEGETGAKAELASDILSHIKPSDVHENGIAVIGMACKVPGAADYRQFWDLIMQGQETIQFFTEEELKNSGISSELYHRKDYIPARGILTDIDKFDAEFFGFTPAEARIMDPQHRVFLEQSWSALEDAGYTADTFIGKIGVYAGMNDSTYLNHHLLKNDQIKSNYDMQQLLLATSTHYLSTKVAYALGLTGPGMTINTACSTGLVSIATACDSLINHHCDMALAGAITIVVPQQSGYLYQELGILSPDGHCRVFDAKAEGTVLSNGCGVVVLRRLSDALKDNDHILGVIKGWALNNDGSAKVGFTAPSIDGQMTCVKDALKRAEVAPTEVESIEAHGTGTLMGDPLEVAALSKAYGYETHQQSQYCALGSVKANIGHTDSASGAIGFIKTILSLYHKTLPPQINYKESNAHIDFEHSPYYVNAEARSWKTVHKKRTAAVHSLGFGGTNAHVILQEAPLIKATSSKNANLFVVSAKTRLSLMSLTEAMHQHLLSRMQGEIAGARLADLAYTLQMGRKAFKWRTAIAYQSYEHLINILSSAKQLKNHTKQVDKQPKRIIFGFTGQGAQYAGMAADIYREHPYFRQVVDECCIQLQPDVGLDLRDLLFPKTPEEAAIANKQLRETQYTQLALFVIEYALAKFLISLGITPTAMIGHSIGEYVAATLSGVLSLKDGLAFIAVRSQLMASTERGLMLVVPLPIEKIKPYLNQEVELAVHNAPNLCVVAGAKESIIQFECAIKPLLKSNDLSCKTLHTSHAFHSYFMESILDAFYDSSLKYAMSEPSIPYISNVTGQWISQEDLSNKRYWTKHLRGTVLFSKGIETLNLNENDVFIEIGPGQTLSQLIRQHTFSSQPALLPTLRSHTESHQNSYEYFLSTIGKLWLSHCAIDWNHLYTNEIRQRCALPTYVFEKKRYWVEPVFRENKSFLAGDGMGTDLFYKPTWIRDRKLSSMVAIDHATNKRCWILFCSDEKVGLFLSENTLEKEHVYVVSSGALFQHCDRKFIVNPIKKEDYVHFLNNIPQVYDEYHVIHTWFADDKLCRDKEKILFAGPYSLLYLTQAFNDLVSNRVLKILVVSNHVHSVMGHEDIEPIKATILGPCKVIPQEQDNMISKLIDLDETCQWTPLLIKQFFIELSTISHLDFKEEIAYRGDYRWVKKLEPCDAEIAKSQGTHLKKHGVYIITGGLGGIGLSMAEHLAKHYHAHLILLTRNEFLSEGQWQACLKDPSPSPHGQKIKKLLDIKKQAQTLTIECAAVEDRERLKSVIDGVKKKFHRIHGVIHAAGIAGGGIAQLKTIETYEAVLKSKVAGTANLIACLKDEPLDIMIFMSSITAMTGYPGQIDYCSANCVLDAYAAMQPCFSHPVFCLSMNWLAWRDVGMAAESKTLLMNLDETNSISPKEGGEIFEKVVNSNLHQVIISKDNLNFYENPQRSLQGTEHRAGSNSSVIDTLLSIWQQTLGIEDIGLDDDFYELGGHSLLAVSLLSKIRHQLDIKIPSTTLFQVKTIRGLAIVIESSKQEHDVHSSLVILRQGDESKSPLFMIHPVGGTVFCYMQLARLLDTDRTLYAFQDPSIEVEASLFSTIEEMAIFYLEHIQKIQPHGPYYLCGASFGSLVVTEMAYQLEKQQETVAFVGLIDGWGTHGQANFDADYVKEMIHLQHYQEHAEFENQALWTSLLAHRLNMMLQYPFQCIQSPIVLFKALTLLPEYKAIDSSDNHWAQYAAELSIHIIPGDHNTMMQMPHVEILAQKMSPYLE